MARLPRSPKTVDIKIQDCLLQLTFNVYVGENQAIFFGVFSALRRDRGLVTVLEEYASDKFSNVRSCALRALTKKHVYYKLIGRIRYLYHYDPNDFTGVAINMTGHDGVSSMNHWMKMPTHGNKSYNTGLLFGFVPDEAKIYDYIGAKLETDEAMKAHLNWRSQHLRERGIIT